MKTDHVLVIIVKHNALRDRVMSLVNHWPSSVQPQLTAVRASNTTPVFSQFIWSVNVVIGQYVTELPLLSHVSLECLCSCGLLPEEQ